jgi:hypothetical protein
VFAASNALDCDADLPDDPVLFVRRMLAANCSRSRALPWPLAVQENGGTRGLHSMSTCDRRGDHIWRDVNAVGHHDDDAASVLGTVQGAALRSARTYARPSGLDGACAQMIGRHLRDGHRMLSPSGTSGALIHPSNGREGRSHMFDRFRTRAFHPLVEVRFSRFCPLTIIARGASLFAFDGAATHHPP